MVMTDSPYGAALLEFVRTEFMSDQDRASLTLDTPLLESGVLDSLRVAVLLSYVRDQLGVHVPLSKMDARNFATVRQISVVLDEAAVGVA